MNLFTSISILFIGYVSQVTCDPNFIPPQVNNNQQLLQQGQYNYGPRNPQTDYLKNSYKQLISNFPYYSPCNCHLLDYEDFSVLQTLEDIAQAYRQQDCDVYTWFTLISANFPNTSDKDALDIVQVVAQVAYNEQSLRGLIDLPPYLDNLCDNLLSEFGTLAKRSPDYLSPSPLQPFEEYNDFSAFSSYVNLKNILQRFIPNISPSSQQAIREAVYGNTPPGSFQQENLIKQLVTSVEFSIGYRLSYNNFNTNPYSQLPVGELDRFGEGQVGLRGVPVVGLGVY